MCLQRKLSILLEGMEPGEGTTELHQAAAFAQSANVDGGEAELLDQRGDTVVGFGVVAGEEHDLPTGGMAGVRGDVGSVTATLREGCRARAATVQTTAADVRACRRPRRFRSA